MFLYRAIGPTPTWEYAMLITQWNQAGAGQRWPNRLLQLK